MRASNARIGRELGVLEKCLGSLLRAVMAAALPFGAEPHSAAASRAHRRFVTIPPSFCGICL